MASLRLSALEVTLKVDVDGGVISDIRLHCPPAGALPDTKVMAEAEVKVTADDATLSAVKGTPPPPPPLLRCCCCGGSPTHCSPVLRNEEAGVGGMSSHTEFMTTP